MIVKPMIFAAAALAFVAAPLATAGTVTLEPIGTYASNVFDESAAEIVAHDPKTQRLFVVNANDATIDVLDIGDPSAPALVTSIDVGEAGTTLGAANSVAVSKGVLAVAIEADPKQDPGIVAFYDTADLALLGTVGVGALPERSVARAVQQQ
ncbi:MAG: hypothetical protein AAGA84_10315 [Pseudomonadota bacterium]